MVLLAGQNQSANGGRAYATAGKNGVQLYQSTGNGNSFILMNTFPASILAMNISKIDSNTIWVALGDGTVERTANAQAGAGASWGSYPCPRNPVAAPSGIVWTQLMRPGGGGISRNRDQCVPDYRRRRFLDNDFRQSPAGPAHRGRH